MDDWNTTQMTPFDRRISTQTLQIMKLLIPYLPPQSQRIFAIYVKFLEFQYTLSSFQIFQQKSHSTQDIFQELRPFMPTATCDSIDNLMSILNMIELFQGFHDTSDIDFDPMSMMQGMLTPEQQSMFEMYNNMTQSSEGGETTD